MEQVLLLTKNIYADVTWRKKIQRLGFEVFCSNQLSQKLLSSQDFNCFLVFKIVIFGESITHDEVETILSANPIEEVTFFRIAGDISEQESWREFEDKSEPKLNFLDSEMSITTCRELLNGAQPTRHQEKTLFSRSGDLDQSEELSYPKVVSFITTLSNKERALFNILLDRQGEFVSRADLSKAIWHQDVSNSTLVQLSQIIGRLKRKLEKQGLITGLLQTHWSKGYALNKDVYESISKNEQGVV